MARKFGPVNFLTNLKSASLYLIKLSKLPWIFFGVNWMHFPYHKIKISLLMNACCPKSVRVIIIVSWWCDCHRYFGRKVVVMRVFWQNFPPFSPFLWSIRLSEGSGWIKLFETLWIGQGCFSDTFVIRRESIDGN